MKSNKSFFRLLSLLLLVLLLASCSDTVTRPDAYTKTFAVTSDDIPANAGTAPFPDEPATPKKRVALTFDDGPNHHDDRTKNVVDELVRYNFSATFFVVGNRISGGDALPYIVENGSEIGIHGYTHDVYYDTCDEATFQEELNKTAQKIREKVPGYQIDLMRPVGGRITAERVKACPYAVILWSVDSQDWENKYFAGITDEEADARINRIVDNIMSDLSDGDIILMHDIYESTYDAVKLLLPRLAAEGYDVVTVSELLGDELSAGREYSYGSYNP